MAAGRSTWIPADRIHEVVQIEPALVVLGLCALSWLIYKIFMREISDLRHEVLKRDFQNLLLRVGSTTALGVVYALLDVSFFGTEGSWTERLQPYLGLLALFGGLSAFVKVLGILVYQYLIFAHMREGVPVLIVNLFTLLFSMILAAWVATSVFRVDLAPLLATSALLSVVIGLALQDTLGNIFAGIALQFDWKPYEIGDWLEVHQTGAQWTGQVHEISWRSTTLLGYYDERLTIPNRVMAQAQIYNYSTKERPLIRFQSFRFDFSLPPEKIKAILFKSLAQVEGIRTFPRPLVHIRETTESWALYRLIYFISDFGAQFTIGDAVNQAVLENLKAEGIELAKPKIDLGRTA